MEQPHEPMRKRAERLYNSLFQSKMECNFDVGYDSISFEDLLDSFLILYDECNNEFLMKDSLIAEFVDKFRTRMLQLRNLCINPSDFEVVKVISRGRFSEVSVVKEKGTCRVYVSKKLHKADILDAREIYFENERNIMLLACKHSEAREWVPRLFYSFHNLTHMYFIVEYCPGGNLRTMLEYYKKNVPEPMLRFYMAEMIRAIHSIHSMGFVHRNIKPDNIVVDASGHLKLIDFRSSVKCGGNGRICAKLPSHVFKYAPDYIAPEIFEFHETSTNGYGVHCDWWSLGIVLHELITGSVPFTRNDVNKLHQWSNYSRKLQHQKLTSVSQELRNIVTGLLQPAEKRLNYEKITRLNYFNDLDWNQLRERDPPFVPSLTSADDTSYCTTCEVQSSTSKTEDLKLSRRFTGRNLPFLGFTFMGNLFEEKSSDEGSRLAPKIVVARRKSDIFKKNFPEFVSNVPRSSTGVTRNSGIASDCSNDSYQSAASVRLEKEVNQLHLFYNEKALIVEENLKNTFHDMYSCMTGDQHKLLQEKEHLMNQLKVKDEEFTFKIETLLNKNGQLENEMAVLRRKFENTIDCNDELNKNHEKEIDELKKSYEEEINKLRKTDKLKKDAVTKLNSEVQKLKKELAETSAKLKETELKLLTVSNQQAAKLAMTRTTLRSRSVERNKYEQENVTLKNELAQAKKEITKLKTEIERKNKMKLDLEVKMTTKNANDRRSFHAECKDDDKLYVGKLDPEEFIRQIESAVREVLKENVSDKESSRNLDVESMVSTLQRNTNVPMKRRQGRFLIGSSSRY